jgi:Glycosyl transferases group 1
VPDHVTDAPPDPAFDVDVYFGPADLDRWLRAGGPRASPSELPYGLERVASGTTHVRRVGAPTARAWRARRGRRRRDLTAPVALAWEERSLTAVLQGGASASLVAGGVIWATDEWRAARDRPAGRQATAREWRAAARQAIARASLRHADLVWCLSRPQVDVARAWLGPGGPPVSFLRFGVDERFFAARDYPDGAPLVVTVGGDRDRDTATVFEALRLIGERRPAVEIVAQTTSRLTPPPGVRTVARLSHIELRGLYRRASVVVVATRPNLHVSGMTVLLEAQASGRPVVATETPGMSDYVDDRVGGLLAPAAPAELAEAVLAILGDRARAAAMGQAARAKVCAEHTTATMAGQLRGLLAERLQAARGVEAARRVEEARRAQEAP